MASCGQPLLLVLLDPVVTSAPIRQSGPLSTGWTQLPPGSPSSKHNPRGAQSCGQVVAVSGTGRICRFGAGSHLKHTGTGKKHRDEVA